MTSEHAVADLDSGAIVVKVPPVRPPLALPCLPLESWLRGARELEGWRPVWARACPRWGGWEARLPASRRALACPRRRNPRRARPPPPLLPQLRARPADIEELAAHFLSVHRVRHTGGQSVLLGARALRWVGLAAAGRRRVVQRCCYVHLGGITACTCVCVFVRWRPSGAPHRWVHPRSAAARRHPLWPSLAAACRQLKTYSYPVNLLELQMVVDRVAIQAQATASKEMAAATSNQPATPGLSAVTAALAAAAPTSAAPAKEGGCGCAGSSTDEGSTKAGGCGCGSASGGSSGCCGGGQAAAAAAPPQLSGRGGQATPPPTLAASTSTDVELGSSELWFVTEVGPNGACSAWRWVVWWAGARARHATPSAHARTDRPLKAHPTHPLPHACRRRTASASTCWMCSPWCASSSKAASTRRASTPGSRRCAAAPAPAAAPSCRPGPAALRRRLACSEVLGRLQPPGRRALLLTAPSWNCFSDTCLPPAPRRSTSTRCCWPPSFSASGERLSGEGPTCGPHTAGRNYVTVAGCRPASTATPSPAAVSACPKIVLPAHSTCRAARPRPLGWPQPGASVAMGRSSTPAWVWHQAARLLLQRPCLCWPL